jgi:hypothetical protein
LKRAAPRAAFCVSGISKIPNLKPVNGAACERSRAAFALRLERAAPMAKTIKCRPKRNPRPPPAIPVWLAICVSPKGQLFKIERSIRETFSSEVRQYGESAARSFLWSRVINLAAPVLWPKLSKLAWLAALLWLHPFSKYLQILLN